MAAAPDVNECFHSVLVFRQLPKPPVKSGKAGPPTPAKPGPPTSAKPGRKPSSESSSQLKSSQGPPVLSKPVFSFPKVRFCILVCCHLKYARCATCMLEVEQFLLYFLGEWQLLGGHDDMPSIWLCMIHAVHVL